MKKLKIELKFLCWLWKKSKVNYHNMMINKVNQMIIILSRVLKVKIFRRNVLMKILKRKISKNKEKNQRENHKWIVILKKPVIKAKNNKKMKIQMKSN